MQLTLLEIASIAIGIGPIASMDFLDYVGAQV
jgi:hypothetical protein